MGGILDRGASLWDATTAAAWERRALEEFVRASGLSEQDQGFAFEVAFGGAGFEPGCPPTPSVAPTAATQLEQRLESGGLQVGLERSVSDLDTGPEFLRRFGGHLEPGAPRVTGQSVCRR